jgi:hypothetical protein
MAPGQRSPGMSAPPVPGCAASAALSRVLTGPVRTVTVTATLPSAVYLNTLDHDTPAVCLVAAEAVRVPCAVVLPAGVPAPQPPVGSPAWIGDGRIAFGACGAGAVITRWWRPVRPALPTVAFGVELSDRLSGSLNGAMDSYGVIGAGGIDRLCSALVAAGDGATDPAVAEVREAVAGLLGGGPGLTPVGDDVLAGALVTLVAAGRRSGRVLGDAIKAALRQPGPAPTTVVSAALLIHAMRGECIPELGAVLDALGPDPEASAGPVAALLGVGQSSGAGLLLGVATALRSATGEDAPLRGKIRR